VVGGYDLVQTYGIMCLILAGISEGLAGSKVLEKTCNVG